MNSDLKKAYDFAVKGTVAKITLVMAILSSVRLILDVYELPLAKLLANILKTYQVVFHTCVDILLIWLPYKLPGWGKDLLILYFTLAFIVARVVYRQAEIDFLHPWIVLHNFRNSSRRYWLAQAPRLAKAIFAWPLDAWRLARKPFLIIPHGAHGPGSLCFYPARPARSFSHQYMGDARLMMIIRLISIIGGAALVMLFNYAYSI
jgi:hypothetical protein